MTERIEIQGEMTLVYKFNGEPSYLNKGTKIRTFTYDVYNDTFWYSHTATSWSGPCPAWKYKKFQVWEAGRKVFDIYDYRGKNRKVGKNPGPWAYRKRR